MIGMATHYQMAGRPTACGRPWVRYKTDDRAKVDCLQCRRSMRKARTAIAKATGSAEA